MLPQRVINVQVAHEALIGRTVETGAHGDPLPRRHGQQPPAIQIPVFDLNPARLAQIFLPGIVDAGKLQAPALQNLRGHLETGVDLEGVVAAARIVVGIVIPEVNTRRNLRVGAQTVTAVECKPPRVILVMPQPALEELQKGQAAPTISGAHRLTAGR